MLIYYFYNIRFYTFAGTFMLMITNLIAHTKFENSLNSHRVRRNPCHHGMDHPQDVDGEDGLQIWTAATVNSPKEVVL
jgi:hypothetical protein